MLAGSGKCENHFVVGLKAAGVDLALEPGDIAIGFCGGDARALENGKKRFAGLDRQAHAIEGLRHDHVISYLAQLRGSRRHIGFQHRDNVRRRGHRGAGRQNHRSQQAESDKANHRPDEPILTVRSMQWSCPLERVGETPGWPIFP